MKKAFCALTSAVMLLTVLVLPARPADVAVIVNKANSNAVDKAMIKRIFSGDTDIWPDGGAITPIDQPEDNPLRDSFYSSVLGKSSYNMKSIWAQKIFTGNGVPPKVAGSDDDVKKAVAGNKNAIGYIKSSSLDDSVKAVLK